MFKNNDTISKVHMVINLKLFLIRQHKVLET